MREREREGIIGTVYDKQALSSTGHVSEQFLPVPGPGIITSFIV